LATSENGISYLRQDKYTILRLFLQKTLLFRRFIVLVLDTNLTDVENSGVFVMKKSFVRERRVEAGPYKEIRLYSRTIEQERKCREPRGRRKKVTGLSQARWNQAQSKRKAALFLYANFGEKDYYATFTYSDQFLPEKPADAKRDQENTLKKLKRLYEKEGFELRYMWFTSYQYDEEVGYITRIHHHIVLNNGPSRDAIENVWSKGRGKKKQPLGRRQVQNIQYDSDGMQGLVNYLTGQEKWENRQWKKGQKRWSKSRNLKEPHETTNDDYWSFRKLNKLGMSNDDGAEEILKRFPQYRILGDILKIYDEDRGWYFKIELFRNDDG